MKKASENFSFSSQKESVAWLDRLKESADKAELEARKARVDCIEDGEIDFFQRDCTPQEIYEANSLSERELKELKIEAFERFQKHERIRRIVRGRPLAAALNLAQKWALEAVRDKGLDRVEPRRIDEDWADTADIDLGFWLDCDGVLTRYFDPVRGSSLNAIINFSAPYEFQTAPFDVAIREERGVTKDANEHLLSGLKIFKNQLQNPEAYRKTPDINLMARLTAQINSEVRAAIDFNDPWGYMIARERSLCRQVKNKNHSILDPDLFYYLQGFAVCGVKRYDFVTGGDGLFYFKLLKKHEILLNAIFGDIKFRVFGTAINPPKGIVDVGLGAKKLEVNVSLRELRRGRDIASFKRLETEEGLSTSDPLLSLAYLYAGDIRSANGTTRISKLIGRLLSKKELSTQINVGVTDDISDTVRGLLLGSYTIFLKRKGEAMPKEILGKFPLFSTDSGLKGALNYIWWSLEPLKLRWYLDSDHYIRLLKDLLEMRKDPGAAEKVLANLYDAKYKEQVLPWHEVKARGWDFAQNYPLAHLTPEQVAALESVESYSEERRPLCEMAGKKPKNISRLHKGFSRARELEPEVLLAPLVWEHVREEGIAAYVSDLKELSYMGFDDEELDQYASMMQDLSTELKRNWHELLPAYLPHKKKFDKIRGIFN